MPNSTKLKVFAGSSHPQLAEAIAKKAGGKPGKLLLKKFSNGEKYVQVQESVRGCDCFVVQTGTGSVDSDIIELCLIIDALHRAHAARIHAVIPHFGYARQDRVAAPREPISAKLVAQLIESAGANGVITLELHSDQIQGFFSVPVDNLKSTKLFLDHFGKKKLKNLVVVSPDAGGAKNAEKFARVLGADLAILHKSRPAHNQAEVQHVIGEVAGRPAILFDDMVDTGGSIVAASQAVMAAGATELYLAATHAVLSGPAFERLAGAPIREIIFTDSIPQDFSGLKNAKVLTTADLFAGVIRNTHAGKSIAEFFEPKK